MPQSVAAVPTPTTIGALLQYWRKTRNLSQLALATEAEVSPRHVCFLETGRAKPSREMVLLLASVLDVPLRERNGLLLAAGFAPIYSEAALDSPELGLVRTALAAMLRQHEPFPAVVLNRRWDIVSANEGAQRFFALLLGTQRAREPANVLRMIFDPGALRPFVANWNEVAESLIRRVAREAIGGVVDAAAAAVLAEVLAYPDVPRGLREPKLGLATLPVIPVRFCKDGDTFSFFSAVTTLGTPQDVTLQELRIECFFPADEDTERLTRRLAPRH